MHDETNTPIEIDRYTSERDIWRDAWRIAEPGAANPVAVARTLFKASSFLNHRIGTDGVKKHPALRVIAGQLTSLFSVDSAGPGLDDLDAVSEMFVALEREDERYIKSHLRADEPVKLKRLMDEDPEPYGIHSGDK